MRGSSLCLPLGVAAGATGNLGGGAAATRAGTTHPDSSTALQTKLVFAP